MTSIVKIREFSPSSQPRSNLQRKSLSSRRIRSARRAFQYRLKKEARKARVQNPTPLAGEANPVEWLTPSVGKILPPRPIELGGAQQSHRLSTQEPHTSLILAKDIAKMPSNEKHRLRKWLVGKLRAVTAGNDNHNTDSSDRRNRRRLTHEDGPTRRSTSPTSRSVRTKTCNAVSLLQEAPVQSHDAVSSPQRERRRAHKRTSPGRSPPSATSTQSSGDPSNRERSAPAGSHRRRDNETIASNRGARSFGKSGRKRLKPHATTSSRSPSKEQETLNRSRSTSRASPQDERKDPTTDTPGKKAEATSSPPPSQSMTLNSPSGSFLGCDEAVCVAQMVVNQAMTLRDQIKTLGERANPLSSAAWTKMGTSPSGSRSYGSNTLLFHHISERAQRIQSLISLIVEDTLIFRSLGHQSGAGHEANQAPVTGTKEGGLPDESDPRGGHPKRRVQLVRPIPSQALDGPITSGSTRSAEPSRGVERENQLESNSAPWVVTISNT